MKSVASETVWLFGDVEFDEAAGRLVVAGQAVELDRNCRAILSQLLRHAGSEVGKDQLLSAGWPNRIVHENSLAKAIGRLRHALGRQGAALETIYGHGYKLDVELAQPRAQEAGPPADSAVQGLSAENRPGRPTLLIAGTAVLAVMGIAATLWLDVPGRSVEVPVRTSPPITGDPRDSIGRVLWVDDHPENNIYEKRFFEEHRISVHNVTGSADALRLLAMYDYTVVISDMGRGEDRLAGLKLAGQMRARRDPTPLIIYTVRADGADAQRAQRELVADAGAQGVVVTPEEVRATILRFFGNPAARSSS